jgi:zinc D-Ala-D-Ala dipeptidase
MTRAALLLIGAATGHLLGAAFEAALAEERKPLPPGFVYLKDIDPTIVQDIRYATPFNFTGAPVPGYDAPECVLLREVAVALRAAQDELRAQNLGLKIYDCYRPRRAVRAFVDWVKKLNSKGDESHYPNTSRADLVKQGYISAVSSHSYGTAVDLTLISLPREPSQAEAGKSYGSCVAPKAEREPDESLDMGTGFDCFDKQSRNPALIDPAEAEAEEEAAPGDGLAAPAQIPGAATPEPRKSAETPDGAAPPLEIDKDQRGRRLQLFEVMKNHGFKGIRAEWWHYQYAHIARPLKPQDFVIPSRNTPRPPSGYLRSGTRPSL